MAEKVLLDWSSADVTDGTLDVALSGKTPKKWREAFERATALLSHGKWNTRLSPRKGSVRLDPVSLGEEDRVRQFLEGALLEANRVLVSEEELFEDADDGGDGEDSEPSEDEQLTQRFRAFAAH
jgi:hypothetical protein